MCTLCLSEMDDLRDEWLREPAPKAIPEPVSGDAGAEPPRPGAAA